MATTNCRDWIFTHAFSESSFKTHEKNGLARRGTMNEHFLYIRQMGFELLNSPELLALSA
jgi:hypothetical protein